MSDYIERSDAVHALRLIRNGVTQFLNNIESTADALNSLAMTADVRKNVHAHWEEVDVEYGDDIDDIPNLVTMRCGKCKLYHTTLFLYGRPSELMKFCPNCGAVMDEEAV